MSVQIVHSLSPAQAQQIARQYRLARLEQIAQQRGREDRLVDHLVFHPSGSITIVLTRQKFLKGEP